MQNKPSIITKMLPKFGRSSEIPPKLGVIKNQASGHFALILQTPSCSRMVDEISHGALQQQEMKAVSAQAKSCPVNVKSIKIMQHIHCIIPQLFDCWADPIVHLLLLKSSMDHVIDTPVVNTVTFFHYSEKRAKWLLKSFIII